MTIASVTRILSFIGLAAMFITDYMLDLWLKPVPKEAYILLLSLALGVDIKFLKEILVRIATKGLLPPEDKKE